MSLGIMPSQDDKSYEPIAELVRINPVPSLIMDMETEEPPPEGETQWRCLVDGGKTLHVRLKYRDTTFRGRRARFIVATGITSAVINP